MNCLNRQAHNAQCRDLILAATERLDRLRHAVERSGADRREELERTLDTLRGLHNRAMARAEAAHMVTDDAWPYARLNADETIQELVRAMDALESRLADPPPRA